MNTVHLRNGGITKALIAAGVPRVLDWCGEFDPRSRAWRAEALLDDRPIESRMWECKVFLDQGSEGACVGFGWAHELAAEPAMVTAGEREAFRIYRAAQKIDQWPGENYSGTSVLAGAKIVQDWGLVPEYRWCFDVEEVLRALSHMGPVVLGVNWYRGMFEPDHNGFIHPIGARTGGHCILAMGLHTGLRAVRLHNSWGRAWGDEGRCWIKFEDLERLIEEGAEVCLPVQRGTGPIPAERKRRRWWFW